MDSMIFLINKDFITMIEKCGFHMSGRVMMHEYDEILGTYNEGLICYKLLKRMTKIINININRLSLSFVI